MSTTIVLNVEHTEQDKAGLYACLETLQTDARRSGFEVAWVETAIGIVDAEDATDTVVEVGPEPEETPDAAVFREMFGSTKAFEAAIEGGLTVASFHGVDPSGSRGYTTADVKALIG